MLLVVDDMGMYFVSEFKATSGYDWSMTGQ